MRRSNVSLLIVLLLLGNLVFFVWSQGYLAPFGFAKKGLGEPERLNLQIHPERITLLPQAGQRTAAPLSAASSPNARP